MRLFSLAVLLLLLPLPPASAEGPKPTSSQLEKARALFQRYIDLEQSFDPALADLYADDALIRNTKVRPGGREYTIPIPAHQYKELLRHAIKIAQEKGDKRVYSGIEYVADARGVRMNALRISLLEETSTPVSIVFGPWHDGRWLVLEESTLDRVE